MYGKGFLGEFVELISMVIIGIGFIRPASYFEKSIKELLKTKTFEIEEPVGIDKSSELYEKSNENEHDEKTIEENPKWKYDVECYIP